MAGTLITVPRSNAVLVAADASFPGSAVRVTAVSDTVYWAHSPSVSAGTGTALAAGSSLTFSSATWLIGGGSQASVLLQDAPFPAGELLAVQYSSLTQAMEAASQEGGGVVVLPPTTIVMTGELTIPDRVVLRGQGTGTTILSWPTDLGAGTFAVKRSAEGGIQRDAPRLENLTLQGPGTYTLGTQTATMDGFAPGRDTAATDIEVRGFRGGLSISGDHNVFTRVRCNQNYYNVLFADSPDTKGNHTFYGCDFTGAAFASIAVAGSNVMDACTFLGGHVGYSPFAFYKFDGAAPSTYGLLNGCHLQGLSFEAVGNGAILDESTGASTGSDSLHGTKIINPGFSWNAAYRMGARVHDYACHVRVVTDLDYDGAVYPFTAGAVATWNVVDGQSRSRFKQESVPADTMFSTDSWEGAALVFEGGKILGIVGRAQSTITAGDLLEKTGGDRSMVQRYTAGKLPYGVALTSSANGAVVLVALPPSECGVTCETVSGSGLAIVPNGGSVLHRGKPHPGGSTSAVLFGVSTTAGGGSGGASCPVRLCSPAQWLQ